MKTNPNQTSKVRPLAGRFCRHWHGLKAAWLFTSVVLAASVIGFMTGCETNSAHAPSSVFLPLNPFPISTNVLHEADIISIDFRYSTNFNTVQKIGLDGLVNLQGVGEVMAAGKTVAQLQDELVTLYKSQVKDDPLTVKVVSAAATVYVTGAVNHPGKILMERPMTVVEAIAEAGGTDPYRARLSKVSVMRVENGTQKTYWLNLNRMLEGEDTDLFYLKPFDVVRVPTKTFNF